MGKELNLKVSDRVRIVSMPALAKRGFINIRIGMTGTVKDTRRADCSGIEFDDDICGTKGTWNGKDGHCWYVAHEYLEKIEEVKLKPGDRVRIISVLPIVEEGGFKVTLGMTGTVKELSKTDVGVEIDNFKGEHSGKEVNCWHISYKYLEKIEEVDTEETMEQKTIQSLREEVGFAEGEEFIAYRNGEPWATCKFEGNEFFVEEGSEFYNSKLWKEIISNFSMYTFQRKPFIPKHGEGFVFLSARYDGNNNTTFRVIPDIWLDDVVDYGLLLLGNVFRSEREALENKNKLLGKLDKIKRGDI